MAADLKKIRLVNDRIKLLFFGYYHEIEKQISHFVPEVIISYCILYYYFAEQFTNHGQYIQLNQDKTIAKYINDTNKNTKANTVYGSIKIEKSLHTKLVWTLKILKGTTIRGLSRMHIGIDSSNKTRTDDLIGRRGTSVYSLTGNGSKYHNGTYTQYGPRIKVGDVIKK